METLHVTHCKTESYKGQNPEVYNIRVRFLLFFVLFCLFVFKEKNGVGGGGGGITPVTAARVLRGCISGGVCVPCMYRS